MFLFNEAARSYACVVAGIWQVSDTRMTVACGTSARNYFIKAGLILLATAQTPDRTMA
jgi:hypothetical protein